MANVLPQSEQKKVWRMYRARALIVLSLCMLALALATFLALIPSWFALSLAAPPLSETSAGHAGPTDGAGPQIARAQTLIQTITPILVATSSPSGFITEVVSAKPQEIGIEHLAFQENERQITIAGSGSREAINAYRDTLAKKADFSGVSVPVSALVGSSGHFSMTITLAQ